MNNLEQYYSRDTVEHVETFLHTDCESTRQTAVRKIVEGSDKDKARLLISLLHYSAWRQTTLLLLQAIGESAEARGVEFLIRFIRDGNDLPLMAQAVLGLGHSQSALAGEFLTELLDDSENRLCQEAIVGLALMPHFPCDKKLLTIVENSESNPTLVIFAIIALGRRSYKEALPAIKSRMSTAEGAIYNACVLAYGHLASVEDIHTLRRRDTSYRLFMDELTVYAEDKIHVRAQNKVEDIVLSILTNDSRGWCTNYRLLREYPRDQVWNTIDIIGDQLSPGLECLLRTATYVDDRCREDLDFLIEHQHRLPASDAAVLARLCLGKQTGDEASQHAAKSPYTFDFLNSFEPIFACALMEHIRCPEIIEFAETFYDDADNDEQRVEFINAVVAQCLMSAKLMERATLWLNEKNAQQNSRVLNQRLMRALAQIGCTDKKFLHLLKSQLRNKNSSSTVYYCLSLLPDRTVENFLVERLNVLLKSPTNNEDEIREVVYRMSELGRLEQGKVLCALPQDLHFPLRLQLLKILSLSVIPGFENFLQSILSSGNFSEKMLAASAAALNGNRTICEMLFKFLDGTVDGLLFRALHAICLRGTCKQHTQLIDWFCEVHFTTDVALKIFNSLNPKQQEDYASIAERITHLIKEKKGPFLDDEVIASARALHDTLVIHYCKSAVTGEKFSQALHKQDAILMREIAAYERYSDTAKLILRNAELTWHHPELFDDKVDKSTMLIQYSKSADHLLQQHLGERLFYQEDDNFLLSLQGRIMSLGFEERSISPLKAIKALKLEGHFTTADFPSHRLSIIADAIMSGKIMQDRYRVVDGLRSWSLVLLLFTRHFKTGKKSYAPLIDYGPKSDTSEENVNAIAQLMNDIQGLRNRAAHHGVLVETQQLMKIREDSFKLLNALESILQF